MSRKVLLKAESYLINDAITRAVESGVAQLSEVELLAILLRTAGERRPQRKAVTLLRAFASLRGLLTAEAGAVLAVGMTRLQFATCTRRLSSRAGTISN